MESQEYVERYRLTWSAVGVLAADCCFVTLVLWFPAPLLLRAATMVICGWSALVTAAGVAMRRVAFRAGATGLTLGGSPFRYGATTRAIPWQDVEAVTVWKRDIASWKFARTRLPLLRLRYVGVRRRPGSTSPTGPVGVYAQVSVAPTGVLAGDARGVGIWRLNDRSLSAAVSAFAPHVELNILG